MAETEEDMQEDVARMQNVIEEEFYDDSDEDYLEEDEDEDETVATTRQEEQSVFSQGSSADPSQNPSFSFSLRSEGSIVEDTGSEALTSLGEGAAWAEELAGGMGGTVEGALHLNRIYQEVLLAQLERINKAVEENRTRQVELSAKIEAQAYRRRSMAQPNRRRAGSLWGYGVPYFKNLGDLSTPSSNPDVRAKKVADVTKTSQLIRQRWFQKDRKLLMEAVKQDSLKRLLQPLLSKLEIEEEKLRRQSSYSQTELKDRLAAINSELKELRRKRAAMQKKRVALMLSDEEDLDDRMDSEDESDEENMEGILAREEGLKNERSQMEEQLEAHRTISNRIQQINEEIEEKKETPAKELLQNVDADSVDWLKIAKVDFEGRRDWEVLERIWKTVLQPGINRQPWQAEEEKRLTALVEQHHHNNWISIAAELGTNRTPFQCLQHYQSYLNPAITKHTWTEAETNWLKVVVPKCLQANNKVSWNKVAFYIKGHSAAQCLSRWKQINPNIKKGKWTWDEDARLLAAVELLGVGDWLKLSEFVPFRDSNQCRERYVNCLDPNLKLDPWTYEEDQTLLQMVQHHGAGNWARICQYLPGRTDNSCLQRFQRLRSWRRQEDWFNSLPARIQKDMADGARREERGSSFWKEDYAKQEEDRRAGRLVVPRPPKVVAHRGGSVGQGLRLMQQRAVLIDAVENRVAQLRESGAVLDSQAVVQDVANVTLSAMQPKAKAKQRASLQRVVAAVSPWQMKVRQLLQISQALSRGQEAEVQRGTAAKTPSLPPKAKAARLDRRGMLSLQLRQVLGHKMTLQQIKKGRPRKFFWTRSRSWAEKEPTQEELCRGRDLALHVTVLGLGVDVHTAMQRARSLRPSQHPSTSTPAFPASKEDDNSSRRAEAVPQDNGESQNGAGQKSKKTALPARKSTRKRKVPKNWSDEAPPPKLPPVDEEDDVFKTLLRAHAVLRRREQRNQQTSAGPSTVVESNATHESTLTPLQSPPPTPSSEGSVSLHGLAKAAETALHEAGGDVSMAPMPHTPLPSSTLPPLPSGQLPVAGSVGEGNAKTGVVESMEVLTQASVEERRSVAEMECVEGEGGHQQLLEPMSLVSTVDADQNGSLVSCHSGLDNANNNNNNNVSAGLVPAESTPDRLALQSGEGRPSVSHAVLTPDPPGSREAHGMEAGGEVAGMETLEGGSHLQTESQGEATPRESHSRGSQGHHDNRTRAEPAAQMKQRPIFPPSVSTLMALKTFLLQHRLLERTARCTAAPQQRPKSHCQSQEAGGEGGQDAEPSTSNQDTTNTEPRDQEGPGTEAEGGQDSVRQRQKVLRSTLKAVRQTPHFQKLRSRFLSLFLWPAFMSSVVPPFVRQDFTARALEKQRLSAQQTKAAGQKRPLAANCNGEKQQQQQEEKEGEEEVEEEEEERPSARKKRRTKKTNYPCAHGRDYYKIANNSRTRKLQNRKKRGQDDSGFASASTSSSTITASSSTTSVSNVSSAGAEGTDSSMSEVQERTESTRQGESSLSVSNDTPPTAPGSEEDAGVEASQEQPPPPPPKRGPGRPRGAKNKPRKTPVAVRSSDRRVTRPSFSDYELESSPTSPPRERRRAKAGDAALALRSAVLSSLSSVANGEQAVVQVIPCLGNPSSEVASTVGSEVGVQPGNEGIQSASTSTAPAAGQIPMLLTVFPGKDGQMLSIILPQEGAPVSVATASSTQPVSSGNTS